MIPQPVGEKWYNYLNNKNKANLISNLPGGIRGNGINGYFVVCRADPHYRDPSVTYRRFAAFRSSVEFYRYLRAHKNILEYHENISGVQYQKPRFDIDLSNEAAMGKNVVELGTTIRNQLIEGIERTLEQLNLQFDPVQDLQVFTAHSEDLLDPQVTEKKFSCHLILSSFYHRDNEEAAEFCKRVVRNSGFDAQLAYRHQIIDPDIYKSNTNFRMIFSYKKGKRPKMPLFQYIWKDQKIDWQNVDISAMQLFRRSCITDVTECILIPISVKKVQKNLRKLDLSNTAEIEVEEMLGNKFGDTFSIAEFKNTGLITLRRNSESHCSICDRVHGGHDGKGDNPYLILNSKGYLYFYCRRAIKNRANKIYLGTIGIENVQEAPVSSPNTCSIADISSSSETNTCSIADISSSSETNTCSIADISSSSETSTSIETSTSRKKGINWSKFDAIPAEQIRSNALSESDTSSSSNSSKISISFDQVMGGSFNDIIAQASTIPSTSSIRREDPLRSLLDSISQRES